ncbi:MAG: MCE family protein [Flavobacteriaceae bacterium]|nr:MCE family protein [Flavobacteriaceae bacterium]
MKISSELKTGLIALIALAMFIWGFSYLKGEKLFDNSRYFYAEYDNIQGLEPSSFVTINGLKVGNIDKIYFHPQKKGKLVVRFSVDNPISFSNKSIAQIYSPDFISGKAIKIVPDYTSAKVASGDTLKASIEPGILGVLNDRIAPLQSKLESTFANADSLLLSFNKVFDEQGRSDFKQSLSKLNATLSTFRNASKSLDHMLSEDGKIDSILNNATTVSSNLASISDSLNNANLKATVYKLESTIQNFNSILSKVDRGEGSLGKLLKDEGLYQNLEGATKEMEELLREMKLNPKRFVHFSLFGKKPKPYDPQEAAPSEDN